MVSPIERLISRIYSEQGRNSYFDPQLAAAIEQAQLSVADVNRSYRGGVEEARISYDEAVQNLLRQREEQYEQNRGQFAGQGILRSGIFATEQGKVGETYQRGVNQAGATRTSLLQDLINQRLSAYNQIQAQLRGAQAGAISRAQARRAEEAQRRLEAQYRAQQLAMQQAAMRQQAAYAQQQLAVQRNAAAQQQAYAQQQLALYNQQMARMRAGSRPAPAPARPRYELGPKTSGRKRARTPSGRPGPPI